jgi:hippurate hydrolase
MIDLDRMLAGELRAFTRLRHDLHAHPQLGYEEEYASAFIQEHLQEWGIPFRAGLAKTGVAAWIDPPGVSTHEPALGLRADIDALPILEETGLSYASQNPGLMHACGHDGHTAILLGTARILWQARNRLPHPVKLIFQPAEENGAGAQRMTEAGVLSDKVGSRRVRAMFGLHGSPLIPVGVCATKAGSLLAGCCDFEIAIHGTGGHAALPHLATDPVVAAAQFITAAQTLVSRNCDPTHTGVVSVCSIHGGDATNVIPETVRLIGTIRALEDEVFDLLRRRLTEVLDGVASSFGCRAEVKFMPSYPSVQNDTRATEFALSVADEVCGPERVMRLDRAFLASEDFAYYSRVVPSCFSFIGLIPPGRDTYPMLHTPQFDFTDAALETGIRLMCGYALRQDSIGLN